MWSRPRRAIFESTVASALLHVSIQLLTARSTSSNPDLTVAAEKSRTPACTRLPAGVVSSKSMAPFLEASWFISS